MSYFDNIYYLDSCSLSDYLLSVNLINAITPTGPVAVGMMVNVKKDSILKSDFEKINNKADLLIKRTIVTFGSYDREVLNRCCGDFGREIRNYYDLDKSNFSLGIVIITPKFKYKYKFGKGCRFVKKRGLMMYTSNVLNHLDKRSVRKALRIRDCQSKDRYVKEMISRCRTRGEKDDMGIICICPKVRRFGTDWFRWPW